MKFNFLFLLNLLTISLFAQTKNYFQQEVDYTIKVTLDDKAHALKGDISMEYHNNAPEALSEIWIHLWGNAYKNQRTEFAKQQLRNGKKRFFFAKEEDKGFFQNIAFNVNGTSANWEIDKKNPDIAVIRLAKPLKKGEKITITTPFDLKLPASFSRLGHVEQSYQLTQWFPKPAVYDTKGWHAMPYLDQGEFYSEFGNFDVSITLPDNYVVGATGVLQTESEKVFLQKQVEKSKTILDTIKSKRKGQQAFPASSSAMKTIRYVAQNVHDFAWFADKRFYVTKEIATLGNGQTVDCYAMFTDFERELWLKAAFYVKRSVEYYSKMVGDYPYPHATAVQSALSAGGGMEYPMITVIDKAGNAKTLDIVITHEVGHNWFYGILASNEREHGWMDEGMNSYYEERYTKDYYPKEEKKKGEKRGLKIGITFDENLEELGYQWFARQALDQPCQLHSNEMTPLNYGLSMYKKTAKNMRILEEYVGTEVFDKTMHEYFDMWKFKHPYPEDFRKIWENATKGKDIAWFFDGLINSDKNVDATIWKSKQRADGTGIPLKIFERGGLNVPISVSGVKDGKEVVTKMYEAPTTRKGAEVIFPQGDYDKIVVDFDKNLPSQRRTLDLKGNGKVPTSYFLPKFKLLNLLENPNRPITYGILPAFAYNHYDKGQLGAVLYTSLLPSAADGYAYVAPLYSFEQKQWNGAIGSLGSKYFERGKIRKVDFGTNIRKFSNAYDYDYEQNSDYVRVQFGLGVEFRKPKMTDAKTRSLAWRYVGILENWIEGVNVNTKQFRDTSSAYGINELKYKVVNSNTLKPSTWISTLQIGSGFTKLFTNFNQKIQFDRKHEALYIRAFAGVFLNNRANDSDYGFQISGHPNQFNKDYMYDQLLLARSSDLPNYYYPPIGDKTDERNNGGSFWSQQLFQQDAGFKTLGNIGSNNKWMLGGGLSYSLPMKLPLRPYIDVAVFPSDSKLAGAWTAGFAAVIIPDMFEIYLPIPYRGSDGWRTLESSNIDFGKRTRYTQKISFLLNINRLNPYEGVRNYKLNF
jgi:hypothetical protein